MNNRSGIHSVPTEETVLLDQKYYSDIYGWNDHKGLDSTMLGRSINLGNYLEAPRNGNDSGEGVWSGGRKVTQADLNMIADAGFATVRIPIRWTDYMDSEAPYSIINTGDFNILERVKEIIGWANSAGLKCVINLHHYNEMFDESETRQEYHTARLESLWNQLSREFPLTNFPKDSLVFELMNEPHGTIGYSDWNTIIASLTQIIWVDNKAYQVDETSGNRRMIMLGTANWGGVPGLYQLNLPAACSPENTIITVHYYEPFHFTHQGASWVNGADDWIGVRWLGTPQDQAPLLNLFSSIETWRNSSQHFEIFLGEFGVFSQFSNPADQKAWTAFISREAEKRDYSWGYWEFSSGFGAFDPSTNQWRPQLITALIPEN